MRIARKLMLLALTALAAMALAAPSAFAQGPETEPLAVPASTDLSVTAEPAGTACSAVTPATPPVSGVFTTAGGCVVHGGGNNIVLSGHLFGIESTDSTCTVEFDLRTDGSGRGYLAHQEFTTGTTGTCTRKPCDQATFTSPQSEGRPWRGYASESQTGAPEETIRVLFCVEDRDADGGNRRHCNVVVPFTETANHRYPFTANDVNASGTPRCEINGTFTTEATQVSPSGEGQNRTQVEVNHL
jgi:hypothetical protein